MISSSSPGKLYIAGEYAVIEKGHSSIVIAVDQFIKVSLKQCEHRGSIQAFDRSPIAFDRHNNQIVLDYRDNSLSYVINSIKVVEELAQSLNKDLMFYDLSVESELENDEGKKYGLGSSAAVTVSTVKVLCKLYKLEMSDLEIFKLAALVHMNVNSNGSCGDVAASVYGGWIHFKTFDRQWLSEMMKTETIQSLLKLDWPYLSINRLEVPSDLKLLIGWTKRPASTTILVDSLNKNRKTHKNYHQQFLEKSEVCVSTMIEAFKNNDLKTIQKQILVNRSLLQGLSDHLGLVIETTQLSKLCDIAIKHGGAAKSSGAGGGDCGIVIIDTDKHSDCIISEWNDENIDYLPLNVYQN